MIVFVLMLLFGCIFWRGLLYSFFSPSYTKLLPLSSTSTKTRTFKATPLGRRSFGCSSILFCHGGSPSYLAQASSLRGAPPSLIAFITLRPLNLLSLKAIPFTSLTLRCLLVVDSKNRSSSYSPARQTISQCIACLPSLQIVASP